MKYIFKINNNKKKCVCRKKKRGNCVANFGTTIKRKKTCMRKLLDFFCVVKYFPKRKTKKKTLSININYVGNNYNN